MKTLLAILLALLGANVTMHAATGYGAAVPTTNTAAQTGFFLWGSPDETWLWKVTPPTAAASLAAVPHASGLATRGVVTNAIAAVAATKQDTDADLTDLADGTLTGSKVGTGISGDNVTSGTVADARIDSAIARVAGNIGAATATTASAGDNDTSVATTAFVQTRVTGITNVYEFALGDETTDITTGTAKVTWRAPYALTILSVRSSLSTASSSGLPTVDINEAGSTILSTKLTIDADEKTSTTAAAAAVLSDTAIADDAEITFDIDTAGTGAKGLKVKIYFTR